MAPTVSTAGGSLRESGSPRPGRYANAVHRTDIGLLKTNLNHRASMRAINGNTNCAGSALGWWCVSLWAIAVNRTQHCSKGPTLSKQQRKPKVAHCTKKRQLLGGSFPREDSNFTTFGSHLRPSYTTHTEKSSEKTPSLHASQNVIFVFVGLLPPR